VPKIIIPVTSEPAKPVLVPTQPKSVQPAKLLANSTSSSSKKREVAEMLDKVGVYPKVLKYLADLAGLKILRIPGWLGWS
jgi:hypothetical protein